MKAKIRLHIAAGAAAFAFFHSAACGQAPAAAEMCPPFGWSEGLVAYTKSDAAFPTQDTAHSTTTDCVFHEWSWEAFVWATAIDAATKQARFQNLPTPDDLDPTVAAARKAGPKVLMLKPRTFKPGSAEQSISEFEQAGSGGVLVDQDGQALFYSVHMNDAYFQFAKQYYGVTNYAKASPTLNFPVGAAIFKAAWKVVAQPAPSGVYTTAALVPMLMNNPDTQKGGVVIDPAAKPRLVTVALVGLHVVGVTENHPEFLWGTFEHANNAPDLANPADYQSSAPVSAKSFTFYKGGTAANACNVDAKPSVVDALTQTLAPITNVFRQYAYGGEDAGGVKEIDAINQQSRGVMASMQVPGEAVWANYKLIGTVWLKPNSLTPGDDQLAQAAIGSVNLANSVMETFVQGPQNNDGANANCFMCHNTAGFGSIPGKNINLSHTIMEPLFKAEAVLRAAAKK